MPAANTRWTLWTGCHETRRLAASGMQGLCWAARQALTNRYALRGGARPDVLQCCFILLLHLTHDLAASPRNRYIYPFSTCLSGPQISRHTRSTRPRTQYAHARPKYTISPGLVVAYVRYHIFLVHLFRVEPDGGFPVVCLSFWFR